MITRASFTTWFKTSLSESDFEGLYRAELPRVYNYFRYRVGPGQLAEDLTSATFEKAWRHRQRYRSDLAAFSTWIFTIARRLVQDHYRKHKHEITLEEISNIPTNEMTEAIAQQHANLARLSVLLARLADRERELVALKYGAGLTNRAISQLSGLSESNVGVILYRTIQTLRSEWENDHE